MYFFTIYFSGGEALYHHSHVSAESTILMCSCTLKSYQKKTFVNKLNEKLKWSHKDWTRYKQTFAYIWYVELIGRGGMSSGGGCKNPRWTNSCSSNICCSKSMPKLGVCGWVSHVGKVSMKAFIESLGWVSSGTWELDDASGWWDLVGSQLVEGKWNERGGSML